MRNHTHTHAPQTKCSNHPPLNFTQYRKVKLCLSTPCGPAVDYRYKSTHSKESLDGCDTSHSPHPYPEIQARPVPSLGDLLSPRGSMEDLETEPLLCCCRVQLKCDGTLWRTGGKVKGKLANGVGSQYPSYYLGTWCIQQHVLPLMRTFRLSVVDWTRPFSRKNLVSARVPSHFKRILSKAFSPLWR